MDEVCVVASGYSPNGAPVSSILAKAGLIPCGMTDYRAIWPEDCSCYPSISLMGDRRLKNKTYEYQTPPRVRWCSDVQWCGPVCAGSRRCHRDSQRDRNRHGV